MLRTAVLLVLLGAMPVWGATARGTVFEDLNANGVLDEGEPGIAKVRVSNGHDVVLTDSAGEYALRLPAEAIIFITKPAGYRTPVNGRQLPQFYYIHQPDGSPGGLRYQGIAPTGPLPEAVNFPLRASEEPSVFDAILFADTQPQTEAELDYIRDDVVAELIGTDARFGMTLGDITFDDMSMFPRINSIIAQIGIPWYNVPGNHELNLLAEDDRYSLETFKRVFGPPYYAFEYGDAVFFVLDNIYYNGGGEVTADNFRGNGGYVAKFDDDQLRWIKNELKHVPNDKLVFLAMHSPLETYLGDAPGVTTQNRRDLFQMLSGREHLYAVAGHTHTTEHRYFDAEDGFDGPRPFHHHVLATVSGSWWGGPFDTRGIPTTDQRDGTPNGYHVLEVDGVDMTVRFKAAGQPEDFQMRIVFDVHHGGGGVDGMRDFRPGELLDGRMNVDQVPAAAVYVNLFDGGPNSTVEFSIGGGEVIEMRRVLLIDPWINEVLIRNPDTKKTWVQPQASSHLWTADLPDALRPGVYTLSVRAIDEFGREHHAHQVVEIEGSSASPTQPHRY